MYSANWFPNLIFAILDFAKKRVAEQTLKPGDRLRLTLGSSSSFLFWPKPAGQRFCLRFLHPRMFLDGFLTKPAGRPACLPLGSSSSLSFSSFSWTKIVSWSRLSAIVLGIRLSTIVLWFCLIAITHPFLIRDLFLDPRIRFSPWQLFKCFSTWSWIEQNQKHN